MIKTKPLTSNCKVLADGSFFFWNEADYGANPNTFKHLMFGWHAPSFYGTILEVRTIGGRGGVSVPPLMAFHYLCDPSPVKSAGVEWSPELRLLMRIASLLREAMKHAWFIPDITLWNTGQFSWKLELPETLQAIEKALWEEADTLQIGPVQHWLNHIVYELASSHADIAQAWTDLRMTQPLLPELEQMSQAEHPSARNRDEEDWLIALGLKEDPLPFRIALRLSEPARDEHHWELSPVLQDKDNLNVLYPLRITHTREGDQLLTHIEAKDEAAIPEHWMPHVHESVDKKLQSWVQQLPELTDEQDHARLMSTLSNDQAWRFLSEYSPRLLMEGSIVLLPPWWESLKRNKLRLKAKVKSSVGSQHQSMLGIQQLMDFDWKFAIGDITLSEAEFEQLAKQQQRLVRVQDRWVELDPDTLARIRSAMRRVRKKRGLSLKDVLEMVLQGEMNLFHDDLLFDRNDEDYLQFEMELNESLTELMVKLQQKQDLPLIQPPANFNGSMRKYQVEGVSWLLFLRQFGLGGCLADDMGLGKTIQFINYLLILHNQGQLSSPALLICPTSVLGNWQKELERFAPALNVHVHYGGSRTHEQEFVETVTKVDLVLTSYTTAQMDEEDLSRLTWSCICLDEAQYIKNVYTKQSAAVRKLAAEHRIALTGTPIENRLTELWSIFDFINPGYLSTINEFRQRYVLPIERDRDEKAIKQVQQLINPFLLRRIKKDPAIQLDLPDKNEMKVYVPLTIEQGTLYEEIIQDMLNKVDRLTAMERRGLILSTLTKLKQICDLPELLLKGQVEAPWVTQSNKVNRLLEMIEELRAEGDRCLIFTQFIGMGEWLQKTIMKHTGERVLFLHGGIPKNKRDEMIADFQDTTNHTDPPTVFVLSLKAGGIGLNLTAANHVFHFDRWWNPAVENQATDRAFRIGQTRDVQVHKFITLGTLEERIDEMLEMKQGLSDSIVTNGENWITELSTEQLRELFALRQTWTHEE